MGALRTKMIAEMKLRNFSPRTQQRQGTASQQCLNANSSAKWEEKLWTWDYRERWRL